MAEIIFKTENIVKQYRKFNVSTFRCETYDALNGFNMEIHRGDIYGFVGKNGAGKTTLIRLLAGLVRQTGGTVELFGERVPDKLHLQRSRINGLVEKPAVNGALTAQDNLKICCLQRGLECTGCINEVLEESGLSQFDVKNVKVRNFSLGMKQRLGIAMALLGKPELLFLDEPLNGLDAEGIRDFRELIKKLHQEYGTTILISSHQLRELTQVATCYGFIHKGKMLEQISAKDLGQKTGSDGLEEYFISLINKK